MKRTLSLILVCFIVSGCSESPLPKTWEAKQKAYLSWVDAFNEQAEMWETYASHLEEMVNTWEENPEAWEAYADTVSEDKDFLAFNVWQNVKETIIIEETLTDSLRDAFIDDDSVLEEITIGSYALEYAEEFRSIQKKNALDMAYSFFEGANDVRTFVENRYSANIQEEIESAKSYAELARIYRDHWGENGSPELELRYGEVAKAWDEVVREWENLETYIPKLPKQDTGISRFPH